MMDGVEDAQGEREMHKSYFGNGFDTVDLFVSKRVPLGVEFVTFYL